MSSRPSQTTASTPGRFWPNNQNHIIIKYNCNIMKRSYIIAVASVILSAACLAGIFMYPGSTADAMPRQEDTGTGIVADATDTSPGLATVESGNPSPQQKEDFTLNEKPKDFFFFRRGEDGMLVQREIHRIKRLGIQRPDTLI